MANAGGAASAHDPPTAAVWEDFIDIFYAPTAVFERRRGWSAWPVLLVLTAVLVVLFLAFQRSLGPLMDLEMQRAAAEAAGQGELNPAQVEQMRSMGRIFGVIGFGVGFPVGVLVVALLAWALTRLFGAAATFAAVLGVVVYSQVVRVAQYVAVLLEAAVVDVNRYDSLHDLSFSLARFLDQPEASTTVVGLAARVDVFTLWATALVAIGLTVATGLSRGRAWAIAVLVWVAAAVPTILGGLLGG